ncbi:MAG: O-linked N-acetylglucosamine transferase, SPINDLY family protein [Cyanobacteria bacterium J06638_20]
MSTDPSPPTNAPDITTLQQTGEQALDAGDFEAAIACFEQLTEFQTDSLQHYLHLGIAYLLAGQEEAAQLTWAFAFSEADATKTDILLSELIQNLQAKAKAFEQLSDWPNAWVIHQHLHELAPFNPNITLKLIRIAIRNPELTDLDLDLGLAEALVNHEDALEQLDRDLLQITVEEVLQWDKAGQRAVLLWLNQLISYLPYPASTAQLLFDKAFHLRLDRSCPQNYDNLLALIDCGLQLDPQHFDLKYEKALIYRALGKFEEMVAWVKEVLRQTEVVIEKILANELLVDGFLHLPTHWHDAQRHFSDSFRLLEQFDRECQEQPDFYVPLAIAVKSLFPYPYFEDNPSHHRSLCNRLSTLYYQSLQPNSEKTAPTSHGRISDQPSRPMSRSTKKKLRVGVLSEFMTTHSVGWLSRWIFQHYDRDRFGFYSYIQTCQPHPSGISDFSQQWFADPATVARETFGEAEQIANTIRNDAIDILLDLDSYTSGRSYAVLALKPAPIQVSWLGYDASGLPTIDYFLADPFVLPEKAEAYYTETIWRLPQTYIAVDGFEIGVPTLRRSDLGIPDDAVVYLSAQTAVKRHPDITQCQLQILKQVPNSYLLIKGLGDARSLQTAFYHAAEAAGVKGDRLRFLDRDPDELTHRANLDIADVVLDTFPYTGATTTLETLWRGIPLVTRVGQQFSSRNSYTMLRNVGIDTGIAHSAEEYVEWGVRYGRDTDLRQYVRQKLRASRQTAPLWNTKQFTHDLEIAFEQMWQHYLTPSPQPS